jgi:hypothetical protein
MAYEDRVPLDRLTHKHESYPYDPTDPELTQVLAVEHGGRTLEVIVPLFDDARIGEVVAAAADGAVLFLLCRYDRPFDDFWGTLGFLVVAIPYKDGRYRAVIAHYTHSLDGDGKAAGLGLYPPPRADPQADTAGDATGPVAEALLRARRAEPFVSFRLRLTDGSAISVARPESLAWNGRASIIVVFGEGLDIEIIDLSQVVAIDLGDEAIPPG